MRKKITKYIINTALLSVCFVLITWIFDLIFTPEFHISFPTYLFNIFWLTTLILLSQFLSTKICYPEIKSFNNLIPEQEDEILINHFDEKSLDEIKSLFTLKKWEVKKINDNYFINAKTTSSLKEKNRNIKFMINIEKKIDKYKVYINTKPSMWFIIIDSGISYKTAKKIKEVFLNKG